MKTIDANIRLRVQSNTVLWLLPSFGYFLGMEMGWEEVMTFPNTKSNVQSANWENHSALTIDSYRRLSQTKRLGKACHVIND